MLRWRITIEVWPYSTGAGQDVDQKAAGERVHYFYVDAETINDALKMARCYSEAMERSPHVWVAPIFGVHVWREGTAA